MDTTARKKLPKILIVDDEPVNIRVLVEGLKSDFALTFSTNGHDALERVQKDPPDMILLDIMMPGMDGYEVCARIKADEKLARIPVVFVTALDMEGEEQRGFEAGAVDYITKPFSLPVVRARVRSHLELREKELSLLMHDREQNKLLHILCHDLSNPLGAVRSLAEIFEDLDEGDKKEAMKSLYRSANQGLNIIAMVRQIRAINERKIRLQLSGIDLEDCLNQSLSMLKEKITLKSIQVEQDLQVRLLLAEETSLVNSVLNNLLTNAIKFSRPHSKILVRSFVTSNNKVCVEVRDWGVGIPPDLLERLFDLDSSTSRPGTSGEKGTGFGMPLVKEFMQVYGGSIEVESSIAKDSEHDAGTCIRLTFLTPLD